MSYLETLSLARNRGDVFFFWGGWFDNPQGCVLQQYAGVLWAKHSVMVCNRFSMNSRRGGGPAREGTFPSFGYFRHCFHETRKSCYKWKEDKLLLLQQTACVILDKATRPPASRPRDKATGVCLTMQTSPKFTERS